MTFTADDSRELADLLFGPTDGSLGAGWDTGSSEPAPGGGAGLGEADAATSRRTHSSPNTSR